MKKYLILIFLSIITITVLLFVAHIIPKTEYTLQPNLELDTQGAIATSLTDIRVRKYFNGAYDVVFAFNYRGGQRSNEDFELRRVRFEPNGSGGYFSGIESDIHED